MSSLNASSNKPDANFIADLKKLTDAALIANARCVAKVYHPEDHPNHDYYTKFINEELKRRKLDNICQECLLVCRRKDSIHGHQHQRESDYD